MTGSDEYWEKLVSFLRLLVMTPVEDEPVSPRASLGHEETWRGTKFLLPVLAAQGSFTHVDCSCVVIMANRRCRQVEWFSAV